MTELLSSFPTSPPPHHAFLASAASAVTAPRVHRIVVNAMQANGIGGGSGTSSTASMRARTPLTGLQQRVAAASAAAAAGTSGGGMRDGNNGSIYDDAPHTAGPRLGLRSATNNMLSSPERDASRSGASSGASSGGHSPMTIQQQQYQQNHDPAQSPIPVTPPPRRPRFTSEPPPPLLQQRVSMSASASTGTLNRGAIGSAGPTMGSGYAPSVDRVNSGNRLTASTPSASTASSSSFAHHYASLMSELDESPSPPLSAGGGGISMTSLSRQYSNGSTSSQRTSRNSSTTNSNNNSYSSMYAMANGSNNPNTTPNNTSTTPNVNSTPTPTENRWDLTSAQAAAMGMDFSLPPSAASLANTTQPASAITKRSKPLMRGGGKLSATTGATSSGGGGLTIPPSGSSSTSSNASSNSSSPSVQPLNTPSASPSRPRNPRVNSTPHTSEAKMSPTASSPLSASSAEEGTYAASCDLLPLPSTSSSDINSILKQLQSSDWAARFDGLTSYRRAFLFHSSTMLPHIKTVVRDLRTEINSLRSSLAKNAILAICDAFPQATLSKNGLELELEQLGPPLLKRSGEPSGFLRDESHRALLLMIVYCSDKYTIPFLLNSAQNGTKVVKSMAGVYLDRAVEWYSTGNNGSLAAGTLLQTNKEWLRLLKTIGQFSSDAAVESRTSAKWSLIRIARFLGIDELDRQMKKLLPASGYHTVNKLLSKGMETLNAELNHAMGGMMSIQAVIAQANMTTSSSPNSTTYAQPSPTSSSTATIIPKRAHMRSASYATGSSSSPPSVSNSYTAMLSPSNNSNNTNQDEPDDHASGVDSLIRRRRSRPIASAAASVLSHSSPSPSGTPSGSPIGLDRETSLTLGWGSVKSSNGGGIGSTSSNSAGMFDLDAPEYNQPASASTYTTPPRASAKRRPTMSATTTAAGSRSAASAGAAVASLASTASPAAIAADTEKLTPILTDLASSDWRTRMSGLDKLKEYIQTSPLGTSVNIVKIFDLLCQRINDHHGKVNVAALQSLTQIIPSTKAYLPSVLSVFIPALSSSLISTNPVIRQLCHSSFDLLLQTLETPVAGFTKEVQSSYLQPLASVCQFENVKIRPIMIEKLCAVLNSCADACEVTGTLPVLATYKSLIPLSYSVCDEVRPEIRQPLVKLVSLLYAILGASVWDEKVCIQYHISSQQVTKMKQILNV